MIKPRNARRLALACSAVLLISISPLTAVASATTTATTHPAAASKVHCAKKYHHHIGTYCFNYHFYTKKGCHRSKEGFKFTDFQEYAPGWHVADMKMHLRFCNKKNDTITSSSAWAAGSTTSFANDAGYELDLDSAHQVRFGRYEQQWSAVGVVKYCVGVGHFKVCDHPERFKLIADVQPVDEFHFHHVVYIRDVPNIYAIQTGKYRNFTITYEESK